MHGKSCLILIIVSLAMVVSACDDPNFVQSPFFLYNIDISGLDSYYYNGEPAFILVPAPMYNNITALPFSGVINSTRYFNNSAWNDNIVFLNNMPHTGTASVFTNDSSAGKMVGIGLKSNRNTSSFSDVSTTIRYVLGPIGSGETNKIASSLMAKPLYPDAGALSTNYTGRVKGSNVTDYTTYMYISDGVKPMNNTTVSLHFVIRFELVIGERPYGGPGEHYVYIINETIPPGVTGFIPVKVQYVGKFTNRWGNEPL